MEHIQEQRELLTQIMDMLEHQFGTNCEIALHDATKGIEHSIIDIRNGHVTGREIGGCGSDLGLEVLRGVSVNNNRYNYITYANNGKILRSSSIHFVNAKGTMIGALCINLDITDSVMYEEYLRSFNQYNKNGEENDEKFGEIFVSDTQQLLEELIRRAFILVNKPASAMDKEDKIELIHYLDRKGAFFITKAGEKVSELLGISKNTFYNYLDAARKLDQTTFLSE